MSLRVLRPKCVHVIWKRRQCSAIYAMRRQWMIIKVMAIWLTASSIYRESFRSLRLFAFRYFIRLFATSKPHSNWTHFFAPKWNVCNLKCPTGCRKSNFCATIDKIYLLDRCKIHFYWQLAVFHCVFLAPLQTSLLATLRTYNDPIPFSVTFFFAVRISRRLTGFYGTGHEVSPATEQQATHNHPI